MDQMDAGADNVLSLYEALLPLIDHTNHDNLRNEVRELYWRVANEAKNEAFRRKLGLAQWSADAAGLLDELLALMQACGADYTITFRQLASVLDCPPIPEKQLEQLRLAALPTGKFRGGSVEATWKLWLTKWLALVESSGHDVGSAAACIRASSPK